MFFFFFYDPEYEIISNCFERYLKNGFKTKGYCDIAELFSSKLSKKEVLKSVIMYSEELERLYNKKYPETKEDLIAVSEIYSGSYSSCVKTDEEAFAVLFWSFKIFKKNKPFETNKTHIMDELMKFVHNKLSLTKYEHFDSIIFDQENTLRHTVETVSDLLQVLQKYSKEDILYFRGHSKTTYHLKPSILRTEKLQKSEHLIYQELLISCPDEFKGFKYHIDYLVKMQHYGLPTRLLDITRNPLVALYFACCSNENDIGEIIILSPNKEQIKYENSDTISMLASLPMFSYDDQISLMDHLYIKQSNGNEIIDRFVHEIQTEKPGFVNKINPYDVDNCFIVLTKKDNNRIIKQDGAFIICGINNSPESRINNQLRLTDNNKTVLVFVKNKKQILSELDLLSINKSTLFPEIDNVSEYIKSKYCE